MNSLNFIFYTLLDIEVEMLILLVHQTTSSILMKDYLKVSKISVICDGSSHARNSYCTRLALKPPRTGETA
jgi:hypothetical protein